MCEQRPAPDFVAYFGPASTVWGITAETQAAKAFAAENFVVYGWQGTPIDFMTDWRPARDLCRQLVAEGFLVACKDPSRAGLGYFTEEM